MADRQFLPPLNTKKPTCCKVSKKHKQQGISLENVGSNGSSLVSKILSNLFCSCQAYFKHSVLSYIGLKVPIKHPRGEISLQLFFQNFPLQQRHNGMCVIIHRKKKLTPKVKESEKKGFCTEQTFSLRSQKLLRSQVRSILLSNAIQAIQ